jgi:hypothetical protein
MCILEGVKGEYRGELVAFICNRTKQYSVAQVALVLLQKYPAFP